MLDIAYVCELNICISGKILDAMTDTSLYVSFSDFMWAIDSYDLYSILYYTHGGI